MNDNSFSGHCPLCGQPYLTDRVKELETVLLEWLNAFDTPEDWAKCRGKAKLVLNKRNY